MTGPMLGLAFGLGLLLVVRGAGAPKPVRVSRVAGIRTRADGLLRRAGYVSVSAGQLLALCAGSAAVAFLLAAGTSRSATIAAAFAMMAGYAPVGLVRLRARQRAADLREAWPDVVDHLGSAVRAGLSLPEALTQLGQRGPDALREPFRRFGEHYSATGRFDDCLTVLKEELADPAGDRVVEALRLAREVGGSDLGRLLRTVSQFLRDDARTRAELETRQGWTVNGARVALAAPWVTLALLSLRPEAVRAYDSPAGVGVLLTGAGVSLLAYRVMLRIARLPGERRVLR